MKIYNTKKFTVWIIDDDENTTQLRTERIELFFPNAKVYGFQSIRDALQASGRCDYAIFDISTICPIQLVATNAWRPIASFHERFPGAKILINSAVTTVAAEYVKEQILEVAPDTIIEVCWFGDGFESVKQVLVDDLV